MRNGIRSSIVLAAVGVMISVNASAFDLGGFGGGGSKSGGGADLATVKKQQDVIVSKYLAADSQQKDAYAHFAGALGMDESAAEMRAEAVALKSGAVVDKDAMETSAANSESVSNLLLEKMKSGEKLSDSGKKEFAKGLLPYASSLINVKTLLGDLESFLKSGTETIKSAGMMDKIKVTDSLAVGMYVAGNVPGLLEKSIKSSSTIFDYATSNDIEIPAKATSMMGDL